MSNLFVVLMILLVLLIYGALNYYIARRGWQTLFSRVPFVNAKIYGIVFTILASVYLVARITEPYLPGNFNKVLSLVGSVWLGSMFYFILVILILDIIRLLCLFLPLKIRESWLQPIKPWLGFAVLVLVGGLVTYGIWNARNPQVKPYEVTINKTAGELTQLHIIVVSDIHLGTIIHNGYLTRLVDMINQQKPDLVLFVGDIIDEEIEPHIENEITDSFVRLEAKYGIYAVMGNHEYIGGHVDEVSKFLASAGVKVLQDSYVSVADDFYLVGRDDLSRGQFDGQKRKDLAQVMQSVDRNKPIFLMDHQPVQLDEPQNLGVDLQFSGHTHQGQLFPVQLITHRIFEDDYGYLRKGNFQLIVSSGYGTWGPPMRLGNKPEIVNAVVHFQEQ